MRRREHPKGISVYDSPKCSPAAPSSSIQWRNTPPPCVLIASVPPSCPERALALAGHMPQSSMPGRCVNI